MSPLSSALTPLDIVLEFRPDSLDIVLEFRPDSLDIVLEFRPNRFNVPLEFQLGQFQVLFGGGSRILQLRQGPGLQLGLVVGHPRFFEFRRIIEGVKSISGQFFLPLSILSLSSTWGKN